MRFRYDVIKYCEVPNECFHTVPDVFRKEGRESFREVIDYNGKLYLKKYKQMLKYWEVGKG